MRSLFTLQSDHYLLFDRVTLIQSAYIHVIISSTFVVVSLQLKDIIDTAI